MTRVCAIDVESTGLSAERHVAYEYAIVTETAEHQWFVKPDLKTADSYALRVGRFYERTADLMAPGSRKQGPKWSDPDKAALEMARLLNGATLLGHNVSFDRDFIAAFLRRFGQVLAADHHLIETGSLVYGWATGRGLGPSWPLRLADAARYAGVDPVGYDQHTALGDARLALDTYRAVMAP